jgi:ABC-type amino acid transport substrate-binding protein
MSIFFLKNALVLALMASTGAQAADTLAKISASDKITVAYRESSVPFSYLNGPEKPIGLAVDITKAIADEVKSKLNKPKLEVAWMPVTSQNRVPLLQNGTIDLECGSTTNNVARGKDVAFSVNYFYTGTRILVKTDSGIKDYADLKGKKITSTTGGTPLLVMRKYNEQHQLNYEISPAKDHVDALLLLESGRVTAYAQDDIILFGLRINSKNPGALEVVGSPLQVEPYACMLRKDDPSFKALVDAVISGMMKSGEFERLYKKWFLEPIPPKNLAIGMAMSNDLRDNIKNLSDKPVF